MICPKCLESKTEDDFHWRIKNVKRLTICKICQRAYNKQHYDRNTAYYIDKARKRNLEHSRINKEYVWDYLISHPCVDCGISDPLVLQFDHKSDKKYNVTQAVNNGISLEDIKIEIEKCEVRCANCHSKRHAYERNDWKVQKLSLISSEDRAPSYEEGFAAVRICHEALGESMTHSTLTWFSGTIKPTNIKELFVVALLVDDTYVVSDRLLTYNPKQGFYDYSGNRYYKSNSMLYWAYVPKELDFRREGKQSQIPEEK